MEQDLLKLLKERDQKILELAKQLQSLKDATEKDHKPGGIAKLYIEIGKSDKLIDSLKEYGYEI